MIAITNTIDSIVSAEFDALSITQRSIHHATSYPGNIRTTT